MRVNLMISKREYDKDVNYNYFNKDAKKSFINPNLIREVKQLNKADKKELKKVTRTFIVTATAFLTFMTPIVSFATTGDVMEVSTFLDSSGEVQFPIEVLKLMKWAIFISIGFGVTQAVLLLVIAGIVRTIPKYEKFVVEWNRAILRGSYQIMIAAPLIFLIWYIANQLLKSTGWFISPF